MKKIIASFVVLLVTFMIMTQNNANAEVTKAVKDGVARYASVTLLSNQSHIVPGQTLELVLQQDMQEHWHTYWKNPGDSGEATRIKWALPEGFTGADLKFPIPERIPVETLLNFGYNNQALFKTEVTAPANISMKEITLTATVQWLICKDICIPEESEVSLTLPVLQSGETTTNINQDIFAKAESAQPKLPPLNGTATESNGELTLAIKGVPVDVSAIKTAEFFPDEWGVILYPPEQILKKNSDTLSITMKRDSRALSELKSIDGVVVITDQSGIRTGYRVNIILPQLADTIITPPDKQNSQSGSASLTILSAILFAVLGGMILNLMPCVFPILSMKALSLVKLSAKEQAHAVYNGLAYTAGILICFLGIAGILIALQHAGAEIGWGFQLQNPIIVLLLTYLLFLIGLNLSGFFEIKGSFVSAGQSLTQKEGLSGAFFTGVLATLVATPCTAPFMGAALGFALTQPPIISLLVFLALGLGLALPYLALCVIPQLRNLLPKPGTWMVTFKEFLAFPIYASAVWLFWVFAQQSIDVSHIFTGLIGAIGIVFALWVWSKSTGKTWIKILAILSVIGSLSFAILPLTKVKTEQANAQNLGTSLHGNHVAYTKAEFDKAIAGDQAVFVNMTASWCITCKINERVALLNPKVEQYFTDQKIIYMVGDWTNQNPEITEYLAEFSRNGVPLYVYYPKRDGNGTRPEPKLLPQLLTPTLIIESLSSN
jgi:thiol:disulfide interchange protein/DsbC/DsbD-like thiol-disulfide interchange protein